jgi:ABC-type lipoprotein release transport system permease subunit
MTAGLLLVMAWRNIWRNKRRTLLTAASIFFAVFLALFMRSMQLGSYDLMVRNVVENYTGYVQIHAQGYWEDKSIENTIAVDTPLMSALRAAGGVNNVLPRLESFALASGVSKTKGALVIGIEPESDDRLTGLSEKIVHGRYFSSGGTSALVGEGLASYLGVTAGDTLVLLGQGFRGTSAAGTYAVAGIVRFGSPELNSRTVYLPLETCRSLFSAPQRATSLVLDIERPAQAHRVRDAVRSRLGRDRYEVMSWDEMLVELVQQIASDNIGGIIMLGILYLIVGFGIFGTILMMTTERRREFGVLNAVGMTKKKNILMVAWETVFIAFIGIVTGILAALPVLYHYSVHPIRLTGDAAQAMEAYGIEPLMPFLMDAGLFLTHAAIVVCITAVAAVYPVTTIAGMRAVKAIRGQ